MTYGTLLSDTVQSSTSNTPPVFKDGSGAQIGTLCRAWVNFNGSTAAIRASFNVSSVTRTTTGKYTIAFTSAMPDANYAFCGASDYYASVVTTQRDSGGSGTANTASNLYIFVNTSSGSGIDCVDVLVSVFR